jgi:chromosome segregation ATPase/CheY-like chemotaxis protein
VSRRILLIDSDLTFRTTLTVGVQKYRIDVLHEPDADEAIALGASEPPELIVVGVEEPEKAGFKIFQRLKKGPLSKVPIMLVTSSVAPESFAKHKGLKTHAEQYVDKRKTSRDQLVEKIDALIGLGEEVAEDDLDIPVEVDDISMDDASDVIEDAPELSGARPLPAAPAKRVDASVAEDVDDAFAGLVGGEEDEPVPSLDEVKGIPAPVEDSGGFDEMPSTRADQHATLAALRGQPDDEAEQTQMGGIIDEEAVPGMIADGGRADDIEEASYTMDEVIASKDMIPVEVLAAEAEGSSVEIHDPMPPNATLESQPAIALDPDDVEVIGDDAVVEEDDSGGVPEPVPHPRSAEDAAEAAAARERDESRPRGVAAPQRIDLGLDEIAEDANKEQQSGGYQQVSEDRDQSGAYDRRALRKIGELERQISQLKTELERARATAEAAAKGGGREQTFLNLREKMMAADNDLKKAKGDLAARERELADLQARTATLDEQRASFEAKVKELEKQVSSESSKGASAAKQEQDLRATVKRLEGELTAQGDTLASLEKARAQLEADLASERAMRAASASDAERQLRVEREQVIARHQGELQALRTELAQRHEAALELMRQELAQAQAGAVTAAMEAVRNEVGAEAEEAVAQLERQRESDIATLHAEHAATAAQLRSEHEAATARLRSEHEAVTAKLRSEHEAVTAKLRGELDTSSGNLEATTARLQKEHQAALAKAENDYQEELANAQADHQAVTAKLEGQIESLQDDLQQETARLAREQETAIANLRAQYEAQLSDARRATESSGAAHEQALAEQARAHAHALEQQANHHAEAMAARERELAQARQDDAIAHTAAIAELKAELDKAAAKYGIDLEGARRELEELTALHEHAKGEIAEQQRAAQAQLAREHAEELERVHADKQRAIDDIHRTAAEHKAALERAAEQHRNDLTAQREAADREIAELRQMLVGAKRQLDEAAAKHQSEHADLVKQHEQVLGDVKAQHERAIAMANGEIVKVKAVADSEHKRAVAAMESAHNAALSEVTTERDELKRGLSAARDTIKRSETELAAAVQTIADRNAEVRNTNAAVAERDQRIADLRKEIEAIEQENASYQEQVLRAYQKIKSDEAMVARAKKAMAIALTVLDDQGTPKSEPT